MSAFSMVLRQAWSRSDLKAAIHRNEIVPFFQPKINLDTAAMEGVEILSRWNHPRYGTLAGSQFVGTIEEVGLIDELTERIFCSALHSSRSWGKKREDVSMAMNFSTKTLEDAEVVSRIKDSVQRFGVRCEKVTIEVTETQLATDCKALRRSLNELRNANFGISADDFGTGYSSLQQLRLLPFTEIKIDRSFVTAATRDKKSAAIIESIVNLAEKLKVRTVAEGVETEEHLEFVKSVGCHLAQGFGLARPMGEDMFDDWLNMRVPEYRGPLDWRLAHMVSSDCVAQP